MPRIPYEDKAFKQPTLDLIHRADAIATNYAARGFSLSLRQLYYQLVTENAFPNSEKSYNRLGSVVSNARLAGLMDWNHIEDRGRTAYGTRWAGTVAPDQADLIRRAQYGYSLDLWENQDRRIEVWVEKQALEEVAQKATDGLRVGYFACKGYVSQSEMWTAGQRLRRISRIHRQEPLILHLGDHDPSGIDMTRDIRERLSLFAGEDIEVRRIALNMDQIDVLQPPPQPGKITDSRFLEYQDAFGDLSWELDAIRPEDLVTLIREEILAELDAEQFNEIVSAERIEREKFDVLADRWSEVLDFLGLPEES